MALWKFSKLDMWQIRLRVTVSSHSAETEELGTEDPSGVSVPLCTGSSRHHPRVTLSADEVWQPTVTAKKRLCQEVKASLPRVLRQSAALSVLRWHLCVPNKCPHTTLQLLLAWAGRACWHHFAATRKETLQYPHVQWMGIWLWAASQLAVLRELYWSRSLGPHGTC